MMSLLDCLAEEAAKRVEEREQAPKKHAMTLVDFGDDVLHLVFAFLPNIQDLRSFALVNKRASRWTLESAMTNPLFGIAYEREFGDAIAARMGRTAWKQLYKIRQGLSQGMKTINESSFSDEIKSVGILPRERETEAIGYDHKRHFRAGQCLGYFGMTRVFPHEENGPLIVWGDFDGVYIVPSPKDLLPSDTRDEDTRKASFQKLQGDSQVLSVVSSPLSVNKETNSTTFFLGYASGSVQAVKAVKEREQGRYSYEVVSTASSHTDEVTSLAVLPFKILGGPPCLASSSVDGTVRIYPDSFSADPTLANAALMFRTADSPHKVLCVAAGKSGNLICTGDDSGRLTLWLPKGSFCPENEPCWTNKGSIPFDLGGSLPTFIHFHPTKKNFVIVGTNRGGLFTFRSSVTHELELIPLNSIQTAHVGTIESAQLIGNILLTSSANEGHIMGWDVRTLLPIGSLPVHPGRLYPLAESRAFVLKAAVMSTILSHKRESLLCLCRDGTVRELSFGSFSAPGQQSQTAGVPQTIASLQSLMADADDLTRRRMQMRTMQAGLHNKKEPQSSFIGIDGQTYEDSEASFNHFSGLEACANCQFRGEGAFCCRVAKKHSDFVDESSYSVRLFKKLQKSKSAWLSNGEETWLCSCNAENQIDKKRCFLCMKWKGGKREPFTKKKPGESGSSDETIEDLESEKRTEVVSWEESMKALAESPVKVTEGDRPGTIKVWECKVCMRLNHWNLHSCHSCERRSGGKALHIPWTMSLEPNDKGPSSLVPDAPTSRPSLASLVAGKSHKRKKTGGDTPVPRSAPASSSSSASATSRRRKKRRLSLVVAVEKAENNTEESDDIWNASIKALSESSTKVTEGNRLGTIKVWQCSLCSHINHWLLYNCNSCGKRSGGKTLELDWPSTLETSSEITAPAATLPIASRSSRSSVSSSNSTASRGSKWRRRRRRKKKKKVSTPPDDWTCHRCNTKNPGSALCRKCYGSRKRR